MTDPVKEAQYEREAAEISRLTEIIAERREARDLAENVDRALVAEIRTTGTALRNAIADCSRSFQRAMLAVEMAGNAWEQKAGVS